MKTSTKLALGTVLWAALFLQPAAALAQGTAFTYQGRLEDAGAPAHGLYDLHFTVHDAASGGNQWGPALTHSPVAVSNGLFTVTLDFGPGVFNGAARWLEIGVRSNGTASAFTPLAPRQAVLPSPYAFWAANASQAVTVSGTLPTSGLNGLYSNPVTFNNPANSFSGSGAGLSNVNAATLGGRTAAQFWQTGGNAGTTPGADFLGTTDNQPVELKVNGQRVLRLEPGTNGAPNVIGGSPWNFAASGVKGATVAGGGATNANGSGVTNRVGSDFGTVGGGGGNQAQGAISTVAGGWFNLASGYISTVGGGQLNTASGQNSTIVGGVGNTAQGNAATAMGYFSTASGFASTAMGSETSATNNDATALGRLTLAGGSASTALGYRARALHHGSFVWADQQEANFDSTAANQFSIRAAGGVRLETRGAAVTVDGQPLLLGAAPNQPLEFVLNNASAWRLVPNDTSPNIIGGYSGNIVSNGVVGAFIGGGGNGQYPNQVTANFGAVLGGLGNVAGGVNSTVAGNRSRALGPNSTAMGNSCLASNDYAVALGGAAEATGFASTALGYVTKATGQYSTALGYVNTAAGFAATALGGSSGASGEFATSIGYGTGASGNYSLASGNRTVAEGSVATAMGNRARALHDGSFVWADQQDADFDSTAANQFSLRASGGVRLNNDTSLSFGNQTRQMINLWNTQYAIGVQANAAYFRTDNEFFWYRGGNHSDAFGDAGAGGTQLMRLGNSGNLVIAGTLSQGSDRAIKQDFAAVNPREILDKVVALPLQTWAYTRDASRRHLGPVAQDFHAAFGLNGDDDKHIATVDAAGVALAAIQGLNQKLAAELKRRDAENAELKSRLERLEKLLSPSAPSPGSTLNAELYR